jgi:hypothetical protein
LPSGWFPDPHGRHEYRWFNGEAWTADVADDGRRLVDPLGAAPHGRGSSSSGNGVATAGFVCGLVAILFAWMPVFVVIGLVLATLGLVFGVRGRRKARQVGSGGGLALAGIITGAGALALSVVGIVFTVSLIGEVQDFLSPGPVSAEVISCEVGPGAIDVEASLTNLSSERRSYTVYGVISHPRGVPDLVAHVPDVEPGATQALRLHRSGLAEETTTCDARLVVHGPTPYGYEMDRVND